MGSRLDFSYQAGTGIQYFITRNTALNVEYRYHHVSNANTASPNEPLNSSKILLGISIFRCSRQAGQPVTSGTEQKRPAFYAGLFMRLGMFIAAGPG